MPEAGKEEPDYAERLSAHSDALKNAWEATIADMEGIAEDLEASGWETLTIVAGDTAPESPKAGDTDRFGLSYVVPKNHAERFEELFEPGEFSQYDVHRARSNGRLFLVTTLLDPDREVAILIAGNVELRIAGDCVKAAREAGEMYTHVQKLDGTHLGTFRHDEYEKFFPEPDRIIQWANYDPER